MTKRNQNYENEKIKLAKLLNSNAGNVTLVEKQYEKKDFLIDQHFRSVEVDGSPTGFAICKGQCSSKPVKKQDGMPIRPHFMSTSL